MNKKIITSLAIILFSCLALIFLAAHILVLCTTLILLAFIKHKLYPIKKELLWYLLIGLGGAAVEILLVNLGSTWYYLAQHFFGIPLWIPLYWGVLGTTIIVLYEGFAEREN